MLDAAGIIRYTNTAWQRVLSQNGLSSEEMSAGKNFLAGYEAIFHPREEDRAAIAEGLRMALSGAHERFDLDYIYRDIGTAARHRKIKGKKGTTVIFTFCLLPFAFERQLDRGASSLPQLPCSQAA